MDFFVRQVTDTVTVLCVRRRGSYAVFVVKDTIYIRFGKLQISSRDE